jgi:hypothetical protein
MPYLDRNTLARLTAASPGDADGEIDLRGLDTAEALARLNSLLSGSREDEVRRYCVRIDPADGQRTETLFLPVGRTLLAARRAGLLAHCRPLSGGEGYLIEIADPDSG